MKFVLAIFFLLFSVATFAQTKVIGGIIKDSHSPLYWKNQVLENWVILPEVLLFIYPITDTVIHCW